jgi:hypothetical protein|tara:strand:- start:1164 stop:1634 length:471 start_codon:yes stop_codon:yes gene_type:complete
MEQILLSHGDQDACFYATQGGGELDLLLLRKGRRYGFEFKCTDAPKTTKSMHTTFKDLKLDHLYVVYSGARRFSLIENMSALPLRGLVSLCSKLDFRIIGPVIKAASVSPAQRVVKAQGTDLLGPLKIAKNLWGFISSKLWVSPGSSRQQATTSGA